MNKFVRNLITEWRRLGLPFANERIIIAVSGGADSVSLALALQKLRELKKITSEFIIAHFNHQLRAEKSEADAQFVEKLAADLNFRFACGKPEMNIQNQKGNLEQIARNLRYKFLKQTAIETDSARILTAHTLNDQAETFLFNILRGSGIDGLSAMKARKQLKTEIGGFESENSKNTDQNSQIELVRPLLHWAKREDTEKLCQENDIEFRQDAMNDDLKFSRVRIRKELLPLLQTFNPNIVENLSQTSFLLSKDAEYLRMFDEPSPAVLAVKKMREMPEAKRLHYLRNWLENRRGSLRRIEFQHLKAIENLILSEKSGRIAELPGGKVIKSCGRLSFEINKVEKRRRAN